MAMDRATVKRIADAAQKALEGVAKEFGCTVRSLGGKYDEAGGTFNPKIEFRLAGEAGEAAAKRAWDRECTYFEGLTPEMFGATFRAGGRTYKVVGLQPTKRVRPVVAEREDGKRFLYEALQVAAMINIQSGKWERPK